MAYYQLFHIKNSYKEFSKHKISYYDHKNSNDFDLMMKDINNKQTCSYEVLTNVYRKIHFDIENIPKDKPDLIDEIIQRIKNWFGLLDGRCIVTRNLNSTQHPGLSYHVIFCGYRIKYDKLKLYVCCFKEHNRDIAPYIDHSIYSSIRLFRLPNQVKQGTNETPEDSHHIVYNTSSYNIDRHCNYRYVLIQDIYTHGTTEYSKKMMSQDILNKLLDYITKQKKKNAANHDKTIKYSGQINYRKMKEEVDNLQLMKKEINRLHNKIYYIIIILILILLVQIVSNI